MVKSIFSACSWYQKVLGCSTRSKHCNKSLRRKEITQKTVSHEAIIFSTEFKWRDSSSCILNDNNEVHVNTGPLERSKI